MISISTTSPSTTDAQHDCSTCHGFANCPKQNITWRLNHLKVSITWSADMAADDTLAALHRGATTTRNRRNLTAFLKGRCLFNSFVPFSNILASYGSAGSLLTGFECHSFRICLAHRRVSRGRGRDTCVCSGSHDEQGERSTCANDPCYSTWFILCAFERSSLLVGVVHSRRSHNHI